MSTVSPPDEPLAKAHHVMTSFFPHTSDAERLRKVVKELDAGAELLVDRTMPLEAFEKPSPNRLPDAQEGFSSDSLNAELGEVRN